MLASALARSRSVPIRLPAVMTFESLAKSPLVFPGLVWLALPIVLSFALRRRGFFRGWGVLCGVLIGVDALVNGALSPFAEGSAWTTFFGVAFVILGDARFFVACEWDGTSASIGRGVALAWIVPLGSQLLRAVFPSIAATPRVTFLAYELLFLVVLAIWFIARARRASGARRPFAARVTRLFAVQYALWATADVVILWAGADVGYALRLVPDMLYYVVFVPYVLLTAPREST